MAHIRSLLGPSIPLFSVLLVGCALDGEPEPELSTVEYGCPDTGCNTNSAVVGDAWIGELDQGGAPRFSPGPASYDETLSQGQEANRSGVRLRHLTKDGSFYRARVVGDQLVGLNASGKVQLQGAGLIHAVLVVEMPDGEDAYVWIEDFEPALPFWISPGRERIESFLMRWTFSPSLHGGEHEVCPTAEGHDVETPYDHYALFFQGDRYDPAAKTVIATDEAAGTWFNIACFKSAVSKLHFDRHTRAGATPTRTASPRQEQALLKMYTADFCGKGTSYTDVGIPLEWTNSLGWRAIDLDEPIDYEAVWGPDGALCLDHARLGNEDLIAEECALKACDEVFPGFPEGWDKSGYLLTANP